MQSVHCKYTWITDICGLLVSFPMAIIPSRTWEAICQVLSFRLVSVVASWTRSFIIVACILRTDVSHGAGVVLVGGDVTGTEVAGRARCTVSGAGAVHVGSWWAAQRIRCAFWTVMTNRTWTSYSCVSTCRGK